MNVRTHAVIARLGYGGGARGLLSQSYPDKAQARQAHGQAGSTQAGAGRSAAGVAYQGVEGGTRHPLHDVW
jgi:hypothetical protein